MGALPRVDFLHESELPPRIPPEMSNFYCHSGKAGRSPNDSNDPPAKPGALERFRHFSNRKGFQ
jgi:hypothetical protein